MPPQGNRGEREGRRIAPQPTRYYATQAYAGTQRGTGGGYTGQTQGVVQGVSVFNNQGSARGVNNGGVRMVTGVQRRNAYSQSRSAGHRAEDCTPGTMSPAEQTQLKKELFSLGLDLIPVIGDIKSVYEAVAGYDLAGNKLSSAERVLMIGAGLIGAFTIADELLDASKLARFAANHADEIGDMIKASRGLDEAADVVKGGMKGRNAPDARGLLNRYKASKNRVRGPDGLGLLNRYKNRRTNSRLNNLDNFTGGNRASKQGNELREALTSSSKRGSLSKRTKAAQAWAETGADTSNPAIRGAINKGRGPIQGGSGTPVRGPDGRDLLESQLKQKRAEKGIPEKGKPNTLITKIRDWAYGYGLDPKNYASWTIRAGDGGKVLGRNGEVLSDGTYMYVVDKNNNIRYLPTDPTTSGEIQYRAHTQLAGGENVWGAGLFKIKDGKFVLVNTASGHYKPTKAHLDYTRELMEKQGFAFSGEAKKIFRPYIPDRPLWHPEEITRLAKDVVGTIHVGTQRLLLRRNVQERINRPTVPPELEDLMPY